ncbi:carboxyl transferase domain-containing protein [Denitromonas sp.]|uniref:carboxyl transferase domain-containing protein n=1 Tax=Denitromonas sp. TaxID=2734609 RepID=UPI003A8832E9
MIRDPFIAMTTAQRLQALFGEHMEAAPAPDGLALGVAECDGKTVRFAATRPEVRTGTLGVAECDALTRFVASAPGQCDAFVFLVDSAGARLDDGLPIQGALRRAMRALVDARLDGLPSLALLGRNAFGGASLLAYALSAQSYSVDTRMAMTGPRVLQKASGVSEAEVAAVITGPARCAQAGLTLCEPGEQPQVLRHWLRTSDQPPSADRARLHARMAVAGLAAHGDDPVLASPRTLSCRRGVTPGAADLMKLADAIETLPSGSAIELGWIGHSGDLRDEAVVQSEYLAALSRVLRERTRSGIAITLRLTDEISGGLMIALAAGATEVVLAPGGRVLTLPPDALQNIFKTDADMTTEHGDPLAAGAVDRIDQ